MRIDDNEISSKDQWTVFLLCLFFGIFGAHRFYVKKYATGFLYAFFGTMVFSIRFFEQIRLALGIQGMLNSIIFGFFGCALVGVAISYDLYAIVTECFSDNEGKIIVSEKKRVYLSYKEKFLKTCDRIILVLIVIAYLIGINLLRGVILV